MCKGLSKIGDSPPAESRTPAASIRRGARIRFKKILVTGGAGFIGSAFVRLLRDCPRDQRESRAKSRERGLSLIVVDKLTYAGDLERLKEVKGKYKFYKADICNKKLIDAIFKNEKPEVLVHFAAESHVDRSINDASPFIDTNIKGTQVLLDAARSYRIKKFIFISTDEVYGEISRGKFNEDSHLKPNSPYAASKAAADLLVQAYIRTYKFPAIIIRPCNNYGPWQYPEKLIPVAILKVLKGKKVPLYGKGLNVREWLYVEDCAAAILAILKKGRLREVYNLGSGEESRNINTIGLILRALGAPKDSFEYVCDRPGHDLRYSLDSRKLYKQIGWKPEIKFREGIELTVLWCLRNRNWLLSK